MTMLIFSGDGLKIKIENYTGAILTDAEDAGTSLIYVIGGVLVDNAVVILIKRRRLNG